MLTQVSTVKARLALDPTDLTYDTLLLRAIIAVSARFDQETNRALARTVDFQQEFNARDLEVIAGCYPIETVSKFELKTTEAGGWIEQRGVDYLIRNQCIICLAGELEAPQTEFGRWQPAIARVTYTGGYLAPGSDAVAPAVSLPADLEQAAIEQTVFWFQTRDKVGVVRQWPSGGNYTQYADTDLLPSVRETLRRYTRYAV